MSGGGIGGPEKCSCPCAGRAIGERAIVTTAMAVANRAWTFMDGSSDMKKPCQDEKAELCRFLGNPALFVSKNFNVARAFRGSVRKMQICHVMMTEL